MKPLTLRWIDKYKNAEHQPTTPDVVFATSVQEEDIDSEVNEFIFITIKK